MLSACLRLNVAPPSRCTSLQHLQMASAVFNFHMRRSHMLRCDRMLRCAAAAF